MIDRPVRVGIVGAGNVLPAYLQVIDKLVPRGLAAEGPICARETERWPELLHRRPGATLVAEAADVIASDVDVVVVITPPATHGELVRASLEAGKHVLVEKPFATSRKEGEALAALAREHGLHILAAPFVHLSPTFRTLWTMIDDDAIGRVHSARGLYGNTGVDWAAWYHTSGSGPLPELGIYNLKSLTALLGPVVEVTAAEARAVSQREIGGIAVENPDSDVVQVILRHRGGALSVVTASQAVQSYRRTALELYGTDGTANLLGDDWDPRGLDVWRNETGYWQGYDAVEPTWSWADGLRELVLALVEGRAPLADLDHDLHLLDLLAAARRSAAERVVVEVDSTFELDLRYEVPTGAHKLHDHTRSSDEQ